MEQMGESGNETYLRIKKTKHRHNTEAETQAWVIALEAKELI